MALAVVRKPDRPTAGKRATSAGLLPTAWFGGLALVLVGLLLGSMVVGVAIGSVRIPAGTVIDVVGAKTLGLDSGSAANITQIVWELRVPRVAMAALVGAGLSVVGVAVQALVRNPIADPYVLGVSSGASVGAAVVIVFGSTAGLAALGVSGAAFVTASLSMGLVYLVARRGGGGLDPLRLVLTGVVAGYILSGVTSYLVFLGDPRGAQQVVFWLLGSFGRARWSMLALPAIVLAVVLVWLLVRSRPLDGLLAGDDAAVTFGVPIARVRLELFVATAALTAVMVAVSGAVGFVGLVVPHIVRLLFGGLHRRLLIASALFGSVFMVWVDLAARTLASPQEIPVGIITAIVGGPLFLFLMSRSDRRVGLR